MDQADSVHSTPPTNTSASNPPGGPESPQDSFYLPTDVSPEEVFQAIGRLRKEARDEIDRLIGFLDKTDDYVSRELEDAVDDVACDGPDEGNDEPSLGWTDQETRWGRHAWSADIDVELDQCDDEPSLGSGNTHLNQTRWTEGNSDEREGDAGCDDREDVCEDEGAEHDGCEPDDDREPSMGWTVDGSIEHNSGGIIDAESGVGARPPQNRTTVPPTVQKIRASIPSRDRTRFDRAVKSWADADNMLCGGELSFPGGQQAFDAMMRGKL